ncbi:Rid family detoxifying hydrolase [Longispora urticae]
MQHFQTVTSPDLPALGPYSPATKAGGLIFVSAQTGVDPKTGTLPDGGFEAEVRQALTNLNAVLTAAGADLTHVVQTTVFYTDLNNLATINNVYAEHFPTDAPARSAAVVTLAGGRGISLAAIAVA